MDFSNVLRVLGSARGRDVWVAVGSYADGIPQAAVLHGSLGQVDVPGDAAPGEQQPIAFVPVEIAQRPDLSESVGVALDPAEFQEAEGSLPGDLFVRFRDYNVRVATL